MIYGLGVCTVEAWPDYLDQGQASIEYDTIKGKTYQISIDGVSSARILGNGCKVRFMDETYQPSCELSAGSYDGAQFIASCGNDVVTQYTIIQGSRGW